MNREQAYALMVQHTPSESLQRHMLNVEAAMRWYARHWNAQGMNEDEEQYAVAGLLHDFDYELHPEEHPSWGVNYLREHTDVAEPVLDAIMGHAAYTSTPRQSQISKTLFAVDELTGLIQAAVLVRPDKDIQQLELKSVKKRFKAPSFAAGVNREEVAQGAEELDVPLEEHMANVLKALQELDAAGNGVAAPEAGQ
ncbi:HD domain-containing protein [Deinococcus sp. Marseille-Q6407]|uniref:HD domain-containing protein n=1 Tax=Deinococcus sp. Marseille-Q6407 TaxID=2969223 RepID=UPI0021C22492|nr:HD domain-containing protein [Deinococcus sp. Marseille-Q6407]